MPVVQIIYLDMRGEDEIPYNLKESAKYTEKTEYPVESMMFNNFK